ncbi:MAG: M48 family metallopeptidase [Pseudomonadota bacterium]
MSSYPAWFIDGESAGRHVAEVYSDDQDLVIARDDGRDLTRWPTADVRALRDRGLRDSLILRIGDGDARLVLDAPQAVQWASETLPALSKVDMDRLGLRRIAIWGSAALVAVLAMIFVIIPGLANLMAPLVPPQQEVRIGEAVRTQAAGIFTRAPEDKRFCVDRAGLGALDAMAEPLLRDVDMPYPVTINVINGRMVNAFAAPGGQVIILRGLIDAAETPEEVAAVLAHEIGHVVARDPVRLMLRSAGTAGILSMLLGDITGGTLIATVSTQLIDASYSREAERAADKFAADTLVQAGVSPNALADFFNRLLEGQGGGDTAAAFGYFSSHPPTAERISEAQARALGAVDRPILSPGQWSNLQDICDSVGTAR